MRRIIASISLLAAVIFSGYALPVYAQFDPFNQACNGVSGSTVCEEAAKPQTTSSNSLYGPDGIITKAIGLISIITGIASVIVLIIAGFRYITAGGDPGNITNAKNTAKYAVIGVVVTLFARAIIVFVFNKL
ncbi:MAG: pilin [Candidatus Saccharibacteria bacterium]|nr:pilin [Candidatus Saccharibacteria bacterium]